MTLFQIWSEWDRYCDRPTYLEYQNAKDSIYRKGHDLIGFEIIHANIVVRHGARTPLNESTCWTNSFDQENKKLVKILNVPNQINDTYFNEVHDVDGSQEESEWGQLLTIGKEQEELNGEIIADRYFNSVSDKNNMEVYLRHTATERTKISAIHLALGLMSAFEKDNNNMNKKSPIVFPKIQKLHSALSKNDKLLTKRCPRVKALEKELKASREFLEIRNYYEDVRQLFEFKLSALNKERSYNNQIKWSYDSMDCILTHYCTNGSGKDPIFSSHELKVIFEALKAEEFLPFSWRKGLISKRAMADYLQDMLNRVENNLLEVKSSAYISLAHDSTITFLLGALSDGKLVESSPDKSILELVPYAAMLAFEFIKSIRTNEMYIRVYYLESNITGSIKGCEGLDICSYDIFKKSFEDWAADLPSCELEDDPFVIIDQ